ncbi:hypothetical protein J6590_007226 [Homalodisca vitripennis]|nr:hypothetical protein J6590_007226 [Homalodisca vitripennis]
MDNHQGRTGALIGRGPREKGGGITGGDLRAGSRKIGSGCVRPFLAANSRTKIPSFFSHWANYRPAADHIWCQVWGWYRLQERHQHARWRVRVADLLRAALGVNRRSSQAARTESHLPTLEATVRTASRPDAEDAERWREQDETDRDQSGSMSTPRTKTDIKLTVR